MTRLFKSVYTFILCLTVSVLALISCRHGQAMRSEAQAMQSEAQAMQSNPWDSDSLWYQSINEYDTAKIDVLYFVSTEVLSAKDTAGQTLWQSRLVPEDLANIDAEIKWVGENMFFDDFNLCAPYYHQFTFEAICQLDEGQMAEVYNKVSDEACAAFDSYMNQRNHGRPFVLAGFSQGAMLTLDIVKHMTDQQLSQMIACYTIGYRLSAEDLKHPNIQAATGECDRGVVISFNSTQTIEAIWSRVADGAATCINPVNWSTDATPATFTFRGTTNEVHVDTVSNVLLVKTDNPSFYYHYYDKATFYKDAAVHPDNLHHWDLLFYSRMIHDNALKRAGRL